MSRVLGMKWGVRNHRQFDENGIESEPEEDIEPELIESTLKEIKEKRKTREGLALNRNLNALGNEEQINQACDLIQVLGIVEDYY